MKQLILDYTPYCTRAAVVEDGNLEDFSVERANFRGIVGNIYKGKVENVICGMQAAFVNIGEERNGFCTRAIRSWTAEDLKEICRKATKLSTFLPATSLCAKP